MPQVYQGEPSLSPDQQIQWQFGDWLSLQEISLPEIEEYEAKIQLSLIVAVAHLQQGDKALAKRYIQHALEWGASRELCSRILLSGAYNSLGRASLIQQDSISSTEHFSQSVALGTPCIDTRLITPIRMVHQAMLLDMAPEQVKDWHLLLSKSQSRCPVLGHDKPTPSSLIQQLMSKLDQLLEQLMSEGNEMALDGVIVFDQKDPFLPGKLALALAYWATEHSPSDARTQERCKAFHHIKDWTKDIKIQSWGIDFYLRGLWTLQQAGLLHKCVNAESLARLKKQLDWRTFVNKETYELKNKPSNFYGVAYSIAYHRYQLGWEGPEDANALLEKISDHYQATAGEFGFADETQGKGRYDRYSFLLIAEISHRFREADLPLPKRMKVWLKNSADYVLINLNKQGDGFQYGRSIGAYGDTAFLEILSAAVWFNVLTQQEQKMAYHFSFLCTRKFIDYWWDEKRGSVNLWEDGRTTDAYRGKHRILGENFSLIYQHLYTQRIWLELGYRADQLDEQAYSDWLGELPKATLTWFNKDLVDENQQAVLTWRDSDAIFNIPLINGEQYYDHSTYLPIPYTSNGVQGIPGVHMPLLIPKIIEKNGKSSIPVSNFKNIQLFQTEEGFCLSWKHEALAVIGCKHPTFSADVSLESCFYLIPGHIKRCDDFTCSLEKINSIETEWTNSPNIKKIDSELSEISFSNSLFSKVSFEGYDRIKIEENYVSLNKKLLSTGGFKTSWKISF